MVLGSGFGVRGMREAQATPTECGIWSWEFGIFSPRPPLSPSPRPRRVRSDLRVSSFPRLLRIGNSEFRIPNSQFSPRLFFQARDRIEDEPNGLVRKINPELAGGGNRAGGNGGNAGARPPFGAGY